MIACNSYAQTAVDFTAVDCGGATRNLFTELDNGKIVVLVWVEPCVGCISDAQAAYKAVQSFASSNPNKVLFWLSDDVGDTPCATLNSWAQTNGIPTAHIQLFENTGNTIDENNYGGLAMPHVVVIGNSNHHIYCNIKGGANDSAAIATAIYQAITSSVQEINQDFKFTVYPNPANELIQVRLQNAKSVNTTLELIDMLGNILQTENFNFSTNQNVFTFRLNQYIPNGNYFLKCSNHLGCEIFSVVKNIN